MPKLHRVKARKVAPKPVRATLHTRKRCYAGHAMSGDNVDRYEAKGVSGYARSERTQPAQVRWMGCRRCRRDARTRWRVKDALKRAAAIIAQRKAAKAAIKDARPAAKTTRTVARKVTPKAAPKGDAPMFSYKDAKPEAQLAHMTARNVARKATRKGAR